MQTTPNVYEAHFVEQDEMDVGSGYDVHNPGWALIIETSDGVIDDAGYFGDLDENGVSIHSIGDTPKGVYDPIWIRLTLFGYAVTSEAGQAFAVAGTFETALDFAKRIAATDDQPILFKGAQVNG